MAVTSRSNLKAYFQTGDKPSQGQFEDLIDSLVHKNDASDTVQDSTLKITGSETYISGSETIVLGLEVSGSILPGTSNAFDLGSPDKVWKDLFLSENSLQFISQSGEVTRVSQDDAKKVFEGRKSSAGMPLKKVRGFTSASTFIDLEATNRSAGDRIDIKVANTFEALSVSTARTSLGPKETVPLELTGSLKIRPATATAGDNDQHEFHGKYQFSGKHAVGSSAVTSDPGIVAVEISGSQILSASNANGTPAANFEIDAASTQVAGFQIGMNNGSTSIGDDADLLSYYDVSNSMFDTSSAATSFLAYGALGVQMANNPNVIIENGVISTSGIISASMVIGQILNPATTELTGVGDDCHIIISEGVVVRILEGSSLKIQCPQPDITADSNTGTITLSDPTINGGGDVVINPDNGGNPTLILQSITIPANQVANWTVGNNLPGTYIQEGAPDNNKIGIQIGGSMGVIYDGIIINGEIITPSFTQYGEQFNIKLIIEDGAELYINNANVITTNDTGETVVGGDIEVEGTVAEAFSNNVPVSGSLTLNNTLHGLGRTIHVRSGSAPHFPFSQSAYFGLPYDPQSGASGIYYSHPPSGELTLTLPAAELGLSFHIRNSQAYHFANSNFLPPTIKVSPSGSNKFHYGAAASVGVAGKGILNNSGSASTGDFVKVSCVSQSHWMIQEIGGTWADEA